MKTLLSTTALVIGLGIPTLLLAQTAAPSPASTTAPTGAAMSGFLAMRGHSDLLASELMGRDVYAHRSLADLTTTGRRATISSDGTHDMAMMHRSDLDEMEKIGQITEIVLSHDGQVRALVIGVGGFLGTGERDAAVTMDQVTFASDTDDRSQIYIVVNTGADTLRDAPAYDRTAARADTAEGKKAIRTDRTAFAAPEMKRDGYDRVEVREVSTEMLMGKTVYDVNDNDVGTVADMILDEGGGITNVIIDFGGFLGMGKSQASLGFAELTILTTEDYEDVRIYVDATKEQIQELPRYLAAN